MPVTFHLGTFEARDVAPPDLMKANGWVWMPGRQAFGTAHIARAAQWADACIGEAKTRVDKYLGARRDAISASIAAVSDLEIPVGAGARALGYDFRPYQKAGIQYALARKDTLNADVPRLGKEQPLTARLLTPGGWIFMRDVQVGTVLVGSCGQPTRVTGVFPQGIKPVYRVTFQDGAVTECGANHLWPVRNLVAKHRGRPFSVKSTSELIGHLHQRSGKLWQESPMMLAMEGTAQEFILSPYIVGYLIGNGSLSGSSPAVSFHAKDALEISERFSAELPDGCHLSSMRFTSAHGKQALLVSTVWHRNVVLEELRRLGLTSRAADKHVPPSYMWASVDQRLNLLRGLLDSDGSCKENRTVFHTTVARLACDVRDLVRSLGGLATVRRYVRSDKATYDADYQVRICLPSVCPFWLKRKANQWAPSTRLSKGRYFQSIEYVGEAPQQCISVDADDRLYVTDDFIVTHNTVQWIGVGNLVPNLRRALVICQANAKIQWARDIERWTIHDDLEIGICEGSTNPQTPFLIINYDILSRHKDYILAQEWDLIGIDESHNLANPDALRTALILGKGRMPAVVPLRGARRIFMSGSPIFTRPINLWPVVRACDPQGLGRNYWAFAGRYTGATKENGWDTDGAANETELQFKMRSKFMVRREKGDIGDEIPPNRQTVVLPKNGLERLVRAERESVKGKVADLEQLLLDLRGGNGDAPPPAWQALVDADEDDDEFAPMSTARKDLALAKLRMCIEWIRENLADENKLVIFAHHRDVIKQLSQSFNNAAVVIGGMGSKKRQAEVDRFQEDDDCRVFIGNLRAAGTAIPLWKADVAVFIEMSWSPAEMDQAEERIWIPEKTNVCSIIRMVVADSLDETMSYVLDARQRSIELTMSARHAA